MRQSKLKLAAGAAIVLAVSFCAGLSIKRTIYREGVKSGGVDFSLIAVTPGTNACFPGGPLDKLFQRFFPGRSLSIGPLKFAPVLPLTHISHYVEDGRVFAPYQATIWLRSKGGRFPVPEENWFQDIRATIADERGEEWEMCPGQSALFPQSGRNWNAISEISAWHFPSFPRRGRQIRFKLYSRDSSDHWNLLAEFNGVNPAPGPYPNIHLTCSGGSIRVKMDRLPPGWQLTLVGMVDNQGGERGQLRQGSFDDATFEVFPKTEPGVRSMRVTVAASEVRYFDFFARPIHE